MDARKIKEALMEGARMGDVDPVLHFGRGKRARGTSPTTVERQVATDALRSRCVTALASGSEKQVSEQELDDRAWPDLRTMMRPDFW